jgi:hypothetical protein
MFMRCLLPVAVLVFPLAVPAGAETRRDLTDDQTSCSRVLACFGSEGRWFEGRAFGRGTGTVAGMVSDGVNCSGTWTSENGQGRGEAWITCDDGMTLTVTTEYQDHYTGTTIGQGVANTGVAVKSWSGLHVADFLRRERDRPQAVLPCGRQEIPVSQALPMMPLPAPVQPRMAG